MATETSSRSYLYADRDAAEAAARGLREAGFSHILISEAALSAASPTLHEFWEESIAALRRFALRNARNRLAAKTLHASGFTRSLRDFGIDPERASEISRRICDGAALVTVHSADAADRAFAVMQAFAPVPAPQPAPQGVPTRVRKVVITEIQRFEVPVSREVLVIERASAAQGGPANEVRVPLTREEVRIDKRIVISASEDDASSSARAGSSADGREN